MLSAAYVVVVLWFGCACLSGCIVLCWCVWKRGEEGRLFLFFVCFVEKQRRNVHTGTFGMYSLSLSVSLHLSLLITISSHLISSHICLSLSLHSSPTLSLHLSLFSFLSLVYSLFPFSMTMTKITRAVGSLFSRSSDLP